MKRFGPAILLAALLAGCSTKILVKEGGVETASEPRPAPIAAPRLDLSLCLEPEPGRNPDYRRRLAQTFAQELGPLFARVLLEGGDCDARVTVGDLNELGVYSRRGTWLFAVRPTTGAPLRKSWPALAGELYRRLSPSGSWHAALLEGRAPAAAPAPPERRLSDADLPSYRLPERPKDAAVVIGVESYSDLPKAEFAERDAQAFKAHLLGLGVPERNIALLVGSRAGKAALEKNLEQWLPRVADETSRVYVYFSGHGAPDPRSGEAYLVPWDGDPNFLETTAYPVKRLYQKLAALRAQEIVVALDSCFSGAGGRSVLPRGARPLVAKSSEEKPADARITVLTASDAGEISGSLPSAAHGLFTYHLLMGLNGAAGSPVTLEALHRYLAPKVADEAKRENRDQNPKLLGDGALRLR